MNEWKNPGDPPDTGFHKPRQRMGSGVCPPNLIFGALFIVIGTLLLLDRLGYLNAWAIFQFWPALLLAFGLGMLLRRDRQALVAGSVLSVVGGVLLARRLGFTEFGLRDLWPLIFIAIGVFVLVNSLRVQRGASRAATRTGNPDLLNDGAFFGGVEKKVESQNFLGGDVFAVFGGVEVNLRRAKLTKDGPAVLNANAIFGGVELTVPEDWSIVMEGAAILGGFADSRRFSTDRDDFPVEQRPTLIIRGLAVFGGVDIKS